MSENAEQIAERIVSRHDGVTFNSTAEAKKALTAAIALAITDLEARIRADELEKCAAMLEKNAGKKPCACIRQFDTDTPQSFWVHECDCRNGGDQDSAQSWCEAMNNAAAIRQRAQEG